MLQVVVVPRIGSVSWWWYVVVVVVVATRDDNFATRVETMVVVVEGESPWSLLHFVGVEIDDDEDSSSWS